jgi:prephenate dehydratase
MKIAFQGELGAFSQQAIHQLLGPRAEPAPYQRFDEVFAALKGEKVSAAVLPIENTLHGSVHENYDLLRDHCGDQRPDRAQSHRSARRYI